MQLSEQGLQVAWTNKQARAHGVGGAAKVIGIAAIPLGIGGVSGILEATVVEGEVPLLLPVRMLKELGAIIDLPSLHSFSEVATNTAFDRFTKWTCGHASIGIW
jgi:hypothetical protein